MEFSKKWLIGSAVSAALLLILYILQLIGAEIVLAAFAEVSVSGAFLLLEIQKRKPGEICTALHAEVGG